MSFPVEADPWSSLRQFTQARIALGRVGDSLPTSALLDLSIAQAAAQDAVYSVLDTSSILQQLAATSFDSAVVHSMAVDRPCYLKRPDLGRQLDADSRRRLDAIRGEQSPDLVFVIADGLSAPAVAQHAIPLLSELRKSMDDSWHIGPIVIAEQARVALGDEIGEVLGAGLVVVFIGERPGMSASDSLGIYLTYGPQRGRSDADRNCISNVRLHGLPNAVAASRLLYLITAAKQFGRSGVLLKDDSEEVAGSLTLDGEEGDRPDTPLRQQLR